MIPKPSESKFSLGVLAARWLLVQILVIATIIAKWFTTNCSVASSEEEVVDFVEAFIPKMATCYLL